MWALTPQANCDLYVPDVNAYKADAVWTKFRNIYKIDTPTGLQAVKTNDELKICSDGGRIQVSGLADGEQVRFYTADGRMIGRQTASNGSISLPTTEKLIICKVGNVSLKVIVK